MWIAPLLGLGLGVLSRVEEVYSGFDLGISSNFTWLATAFVAGVLAGGRPLRSAAAGALALTTANAAYYAYVLATEPGRPLDSVAGAVEGWFALGVSGGAVFGAAGALLRFRSPPLRVAAFLPLAALVVAERIPALAPLLP